HGDARRGEHRRDVRAGVRRPRAGRGGGSGVDRVETLGGRRPGRRCLIDVENGVAAPSRGNGAPRPRSQPRTDMTKSCLLVDFQPGISESPMEEWQPEEIQAHLDYYGRLNRELTATGELVQSEVLTGPDLARVVTSDGVSAPVVTDGRFQEFKEWVAG